MPAPDLTERDADEDTLSTRYGAPRRKPSRTAQYWAVISALTVALGAVAWFTYSLAFGQLDYQDVGYTIESETRASVDYEVTKDFDATAQCMLHVMDESYAIVGARIVTIGPHEGTSAADRSQYFRSDLRTEHLGVTGVVDSCWLLD